MVDLVGIEPTTSSIARNSSTSSTLALANNRCRSPNHSRNLDVCEQWDRTEYGERPFSFCHVPGEVTKLIAEPHGWRAGQL
jgi:hypothetical protein